MRRLIWNIHYAWLMFGVVRDIRFAWSSALAWSDDDIDDMTPGEALNEERSHWYE